MAVRKIAKRTSSHGRRAKQVLASRFSDVHTTCGAKFMCVLQTFRTRDILLHSLSLQRRAKSWGIVHVSVMMYT